MKNEQAVPEQVIDLIQQKKFIDLSTAEKQMVMLYLSESEYDEMAEAYRIALKNYKTDTDIIPSSLIKQNLDAAFAKKHSSKRPLLLRRVELWKAAAIFICLVSCSLWLMHNNFAKQHLPELVVHDTVYLEKNIRTVQHVRDTVTKHEYVNTPPQLHKGHKNIRNIKEHDTDSVPVTNAGIRTMQSEDLKKVQLYGNGKTMREDGLAKRFAYARI